MHFDVYLVKWCSEYIVEITRCFTSLLQFHLNNNDWQGMIELCLMHHFSIQNLSLKIKNLVTPF